MADQPFDVPELRGLLVELEVPHRPTADGVAVELGREDMAQLTLDGGGTSLLARAELATDCSLDPDGMRRMLVAQSSCIGAKVAVDADARAWAALEVPTPLTGEELAHALWCLANTCAGWRHEVVEHLDATATPPAGTDRPIAVLFERPERTATEHEAIVDMVAGCFDCAVDVDVEPDGPVSNVQLPDGRTRIHVGYGTVDVRVQVASVEDPGSPLLGRLLGRQLDLPRVRIGLDESLRLVHATVELCDAPLDGARVHAAVAEAQGVATRLRPEVEALGAALARYRTPDPDDRQSLLRAVERLTREWASLSGGAEAEAAAATLQAVRAELGALGEQVHELDRARWLAEAIVTSEAHVAAEEDENRNDIAFAAPESWEWEQVAISRERLAVAHETIGALRAELAAITGDG
jgi:hypothetical protein